MVLLLFYISLLKFVHLNQLQDLLNFLLFLYHHLKVADSHLLIYAFHYVVEEMQVLVKMMGYLMNYYLNYLMNLLLLLLSLLYLLYWMLYQLLLLYDHHVLLHHHYVIYYGPGDVRKKKL